MAQNSGQTVYRVNARQAQAQSEGPGQRQGQGQGQVQVQRQGQGQGQGPGERQDQSHGQGNGGRGAPLPGEDQARQVALAMTQLNMGVPGRKKGTVIGALAGGSAGGFGENNVVLYLKVHEN